MPPLRSQRESPSLSWTRACHRAETGGFTIVELLVSVAVLILLSSLLLGSLNSFSTLTSSSEKRMETDGLARGVYDQMDFDLASAIHTGGVSLTFRKNQTASDAESAPNDSMSFLARARSTDPASRLAIVGYDVGKSPFSTDTSVTVLRHAQSFGWDDDTTTTSLSAAADSQPLPGVIRMELGFLLKDAIGTVVADPPVDPAKIKAVICALVTLDENSLKRLTASQRKQITDSFPDAADNKTPVSQWSLASLPDLPPFVAQNLRFHQRYFYLK